MSKQRDMGKIWQHLGNWGVPIVSICSFLPILVIYLGHSDSPSATPPDFSALPALSQIPSPTQKWENPVVTENTGSNNTLTLQKPTLKEKSTNKPQNPVDEPKKKDITPRNQVKTVKSTPNSFPSPSGSQGKMVSNVTTVPEQYPTAQLEIRVAVLRDAPGANLGVSETAAILDRNGQVLQTISPGQGLRVSPAGSNLNIGNSQFSDVVFVQPQNGGLVYLGDRWYRGKMLLVSQGSSILAVNYVDLEQYLYSVVGSEMHANAPMEALKAQAIAARSYALVHIIRPASPWFHLGNTQRWQVYKGLQSEYNTGHQAVNETAGQILSYKGGVVESLYAATDEIVSRAHGGRGMSQTGAYELARKGYDHQQILGHYYPGVGLARLVFQN